MTLSFRTLVPSALAALLLAGCGRPSDSVRQPEKKGGSEPVARNEMGASKDSGEPSGTSEGKTEAEPPKLPEPLKPDTKAFAVTPTGSGNWKKSAIAPSALAARVDKAFREMSKTEAEAVATIMTPTENGQVRNAIKVQDYKTFSIQTLRLEKEPGIFEIRADGSKKSFTGRNGTFEPAKPIGSQSPETKLTGRQMVEQWPRAFPRLAFLSLTEGKDSWGPYLKELASGRSGFTAEISERTIPFRGQMWTNYRVIAKRTKEAAKKLGPCEVEIVLDGRRNLPVTIRSNFTDPNGGSWKVLWQTGWNFDQSFDAKDFRLP
jgi:hypothetical protein